ncbi:MAG: polysaccharide export protein [Pseudomonadales bacterium]|nr:polysaccharide export protein [Pseudomonadales bacterium]
MFFQTSQPCPQRHQSRKSLLRFACITLCLLLATFAPGLSAQQGVNQEAAYKLGAGDHLIIKVFDEADLSMEFQLNDSGMLNYPLLGELRIAGLTVFELEKLITNGLRGDYLINPDVTVSIGQYRAIYINGEVKKPGGFPYQPSLTVDKAIALAGGFTERAARNKFSVVRASDTTQTPRSIRGKEPIQPGDVITVNRSFF